ncbi:hypothetical protein NPIL_376071 [Nephila pilipes]|uniref:Uncharacterized protein n=1 Tax=Nephila pilipes TaxID=299642 RepID=A0A8X6NRQ2_NEPPI|nr:hypothetical protein NPIL_376071 [Nephila pilipes]
MPGQDMALVERNEPFTELVDIIVVYNVTWLEPQAVLLIGSNCSFFNMVIQQHLFDVVTFQTLLQSNLADYVSGLYGHSKSHTSGVGY